MYTAVVCKICNIFLFTFYNYDKLFYLYYRLSGYDHLFLVKADFEEIKNNIL